MPVTELWPSRTADQVETALAAAAEELSALDARVEHYRVPRGGYAAWTGDTASEVFSLEARIGPAHHRPGISMWAVFQVFDPRRPNLALVRMLERHDADGAPVQDVRRPSYSRGLDLRLCRMFMPACNRALNHLDPTGRGHSQHVDCYHGRVPPSHLLTAPVVAVDLFRRFRREGQKAIILADFNDPLAVPTVSVVKHLLVRRNGHLIPRTREPSAARVLLRRPDGSIQQLAGMSTAADEGITIARRLLA
ncbi:hypothetical protein QEZ40_005025 [Streptomyces katrae]|uniref:PE-PGRS family protein n=1 Tax=Streptomyces katrae TaxID=68223 RepID=A0ABT7H184_9ACTN|nr:hypothetical protein [Streptomyces katrae]MDK9499599.1 hypothetical protein [Streptomyces katrae]